MNKNYICVFDTETGGKFPHKSQVLSLSCLMIDPKRLQIIKGSEFTSYIKPVLDPAECEKLGLEPIQEEALKVNNIKLDEIKDAPAMEEVWKRFCNHLSNYTTGTGDWGKPIPCGYNITSFDLPIINRLCKQYGNWNKDREVGNVFHPRDILDLMNIIWLNHEDDGSTFSISLDNTRKFFNLTSEGAHTSDADCLHTAAILIKWLNWYRSTMKKMLPKMRGSMKSINMSDFYDVKF